jgi:uncharacterized membrane protein YfcA
MSLVDVNPYLVLSIGVFAGALVSGLIGFAFSAVAGAILLHIMPPTEAVPLMMACSIVVQAASLVALHRRLQWRHSLALIAGGALGVLPALYLLNHVNGHMFRIGFGVFLAAYAAYMLCHPVIHYVRSAGGLRDAVVGFGGGLVGGLTAMPGALPVIWCDLRGMGKEQQRSLVQPYITAMQVFALALLLSRNGLSAPAVTYWLYSLPALAAGTGLGIVMFGKINDALFRRIVLAVLLLAGLALTL